LGEFLKIQMINLALNVMGTLYPMDIQMRLIEMQLLKAPMGCKNSDDREQLQTLSS
jgi:hypothetical protein